MDALAHDQFEAVFGRRRGGGRAAGVTPREDALIRRAIWQDAAGAALLRTRTYNYALLALPRLRAGETRQQLWLDNAPGGVTFNGAFAALAAAGLYPPKA